MEKDISVTEIVFAIRDMQSGKSPGPDGFPAEFFKKFSEPLSPLLLSVFNESSVTLSLPVSMRQAIISLLLKKDKSPLNCSSYSSYRTVSVLNADAKIFAKCLERVVPTVVSPDQTGFVKNRQSFFNIR